VKIQNNSLDEVIKLLDGIFYEIDFAQDFSSICLNGQPITDMPVASIIKYLSNTESEGEISNADKYISSEEENRLNIEFWEWFEENQKEEEKLEKKWEKGKKKRKKRNKIFLKNLLNGNWR